MIVYNVTIYHIILQYILYSTYILCIYTIFYPTIQIHARVAPFRCPISTSGVGSPQVERQLQIHGFHAEAWHDHRYAGC